MRGVVVSDLHLFSRLSQAQRVVDAIHEAAAAAHVLVLNGDIFDFQFAFGHSERASVAAAIAWLDSLRHRCPACRIHYVLGNHDTLDPFVSALYRWAREAPRVAVHEYTLQLGRNLFVHGDCANRAMTCREFEAYRESWRRKSRRNALYGRLYEALDRLGLRHLVHRVVFPRRKVAERILYYLTDLHGGLTERIDDIYFGHTHLPFTNYPLNGVRFHNTGSAMERMGFNMLTFEFETEG
ncbi:MAG: metallophosphoesterase [Planctomycetota bacterium]